MTRFLYAAIIIVFLPAVLLFYACADQSESRTRPEGMEASISISGAFALYPLVVRWSEEYMKVHPKVRIDVSAGGAGKGITDVLSGMVDIGMVSRSLNAAEVRKGAFAVTIARDAVVPTISTYNPYLPEILVKGFSRSEFRKIYLTDHEYSWGEMLGMGSKKQVMVYTRSDACGAAQKWAEYLGVDQESLFGIGVFGDPGMADAVKSDEYGLGFNNLVYVYDLTTQKKYPGLDILPLDLNDNGLIDREERFYSTLPEFLKAVKDGVYPSPPSRDLYLVFNGKPSDPALGAFITWVLTEGQKFVETCGYVSLTSDQLQKQLSELN